MEDMKLQDKKGQQHENAGHEIGGPNRWAYVSRTVSEIIVVKAQHDLETGDRGHSR